MQSFTMPIGKSDFAKIRLAGYYYVDKTDLIKQVITSGAEVTLFTRPRRFGKSLNMSMLQHFFDISEKNEALFAGLKISENHTICEKWMNQYPTIIVGFKDVNGVDYESALEQLKSIISKLYDKHKYLVESENDFEDYEIEKFKALLSAQPSNVQLKDALCFLSKLLFEYYNKHVIVLIDEYDVPMAKGDANGYYDKITDIMRTMLSQVLKDNSYIKIGVLTGCLKIAEESIFTGLNNVSVKTITDTDYDECFGFTTGEMEKLLTDTGLLEHKFEFKEWYDGYVFGDREVYCPWDVLNYVDALQKDSNAFPMNYWANTSGNDVIKKFLNSNFDVAKDFETLLSGSIIEKKINPNITYGDLTKDEMNLWSVLYMTGYLTMKPGSQPSRQNIRPEDVKGRFEIPFQLKLPNKEIRILFEETIASWFKEKILRDNRSELFDALWSGNAEQLANIISRYLRTTISYHDYSEQFYHAFLTGLFSGVENVNVRSNLEVGEGRADVIMKNEYTNQAVVIEVKRADSPKAADEKCDEALQQIEEKGYAVPLMEDEGYDVMVYGVVFYKKRCFVKTR